MARDNTADETPGPKKYNIRYSVSILLYYSL